MSSRKLIIAVDGPAASGKGTLSRALANILNLAHLDTGALYRGVAFEVVQTVGDPALETDAVNGANRFIARMAGADLLSNPALRRDDIGQAASKVAAVQKVRDLLIDFQKNFADHPAPLFNGAILDGRDIGTVIAPHAPVKLFVTASDTVRAERRLKELQSRGIESTYEAVLTDLRERDARDKSRSTAPLKAADDAITLDTSSLDAAQALQKALDVVRDKGFSVPPQPH